MKLPGAQRFREVLSRRVPFLYPLSDGPDHCGILLSKQVRVSLEAGVPVFQLRLKGVPTGEWVELARSLRTLIPGGCMAFLVNDRVDVALLSGADGVHLGQDDLPVEEARRILGPEAIIGLTTPTSVMILEAASTTADYVALGPIFPTGTKETGREAIGLEKLAAAAKSSSKPLVAIGGITPGTSEQVWKAGACGAAMIGGIWRGKSPGKTLERLQSSLGTNDPVRGNSLECDSF